jgi:hypothetical protein
MTATMLQTKRIAAVERFIRRYGTGKLRTVLGWLISGRSYRFIAIRMRVSGSCVRRWHDLFGVEKYQVYSDVMATVELREGVSKARVRSLKARFHRLVKEAE